MVLSSKGKERRPKFLLNFSVNELINIPQSSGRCYVKWHLKDGTGVTGHRFHPLEGLERSGVHELSAAGPSQGSQAKSRLSHEHSGFLHRTLSNSSASSITSPGSCASVSSGASKPSQLFLGTHASSHSRGETSKNVIEYNKVTWANTLQYPIQIKLSVDKHRNLSEKKLILKVMYESIEHSSHTDPRAVPGAIPTAKGVKHRSTEAKVALQKLNSRGARQHELSLGELTAHHTKLLLGTVEINVADYIREDEKFITNRFLLKDSKVNSLLSLSVQLKLIRGSYQEFNLPHVNFGSGQFPGIFHTSISDILEDSTELGSPTNSLFRNNILSQTQNIYSLQSQRSRSSASSLVSRPSHMRKINSNDDSLHTPMKKGNHFANGLPRGRNFDYHKYVDEETHEKENVVTQLYNRTFQIPWDLRPNEYNISECIEDIIGGGNGWAKNEEGVNFIDIQALLLTEDEIKYYGITKQDSNVSTSESEDAINQVEDDIDIDLNNSRVSRKELLEKQKQWTSISEGLYKNNTNPSLKNTTLDSYLDAPRDRITWRIRPIK
ncbi:hypothetical protein TPHA_0K00710 [Tetrapisispora phaffii CBS 4417]|uniref:C2 NT-type domain-containing protein n=1 Tax=Tetrapisispora phaffii (strain ATCC 24235 / CBS 4417 / NBRC 1672 / NRRL Y-8282 / UCD 70-5) TaxID=1071381 RepID=G8BZ77_TETPH|nr:hypothetical protein TPHA_0K00710 [Tetrapisispora phaffii CBS 4417]CCE65205.1 hypothetical protein TPHA_0K00710 [Tetrapisispora phaffii CBS 4417]